MKDPFLYLGARKGAFMYFRRTRAAPETVTAQPPQARADSTIAVTHSATAGRVSP